MSSIIYLSTGMLFQHHSVFTPEKSGERYVTVLERVGVGPTASAVWDQALFPILFFFSSMTDEIELGK